MAPHRRSRSARVYDPRRVGYFLQTDPIPQGSANAYDYVNQDPVNLTDLAGLSAPNPCGPAGKRNPKVAKRACRAMYGHPQTKLKYVTCAIAGFPAKRIPNPFSLAAWVVCAGIGYGDAYGKLKGRYGPH